MDSKEDPSVWEVTVDWEEYLGVAMGVILEGTIMAEWLRGSLSLIIGKEIAQDQKMNTFET
jgi:hypothetical protein